MKLRFKIGKYGIEMDNVNKVIEFHDLGARGVITEVESLYENTIFWLGSIGYAIEDLAVSYDSIARVTSQSFPDLAVKSRMNVSTYNYYGIVGRHMDYRNWYMVYFNANNSTADHVIAKSVDGTISTLATEAVDLTGGQWYWVMFECIGTTINSFRASTPTDDVPSTPTLSVTDADLTNGRWGVRHVGLGGKGLQGLFLIFKQPVSSPRKPLKFFEVPVRGDGTLDNPFEPVLPKKIVDMGIEVVDNRYYMIASALQKIAGRKRSLTAKKAVEDAIVQFAEALGLVYRKKINKYACTYSVFYPTPKGKPIDGYAVVRIIDIPAKNPDKVVEEIRNIQGVRELSRDEAIKLVMKKDDRLHKYDIEPAKDEKAAEEYIEWREYIVGAKKIDTRLMKHYVSMYKGW